MFFVARHLRKLLGDVATLNGPNPSDPQIKDDGAFWKAVSGKGMLGLGESYVLGHWDCADLAGFFYRAIEGGLLEAMARSLPMMLLRLRYCFGNHQSLFGAKKNARAHYGQGNRLFEVMLDRRLTYSCALWSNPTNLEDEETLDIAQESKLDLICKKLDLKPGMEVLDIGCGWGSLMGFAAERYSAVVTGITPVPEQVKYIQARYGHLPVTAILTDYRQIDGSFDRIVSVGMLEHVGWQNYAAYMDTVNRCLRDDGISLVHCFGLGNRRIPLPDPWTEKYIFPGGYLPTLGDIVENAEKHFDVVDVHEFGLNYWKTLINWCRRFDLGFEKISADYGPEFRRMWRYYLLSCAAVFQARKVLLWQTVMTRRGSKVEYRPVR